MRIVLVDDEPLARQAMRQLLAAHAEVEIVAEAATVVQAHEAILAAQPDAVFLDIQMPGADAFHLLRQLAAIPPIVFVTAYSRYAVQAFELPAADYLLKPVRPERLAETLVRLHALVRPDQASTSGAGEPERITFRTPERTLVCPLTQLIALEAEGDFVRIFVENEKPFLICQTLGSYLSMLPNPPFSMIGRSLVINAGRVRKVESANRNETLLYLDGVSSPISIGRAAARRLRILMGKE